MSTVEVAELTKSPNATATDERLLGLTRTILEDLFGPVDQRRFGLRYWNGESDVPPSLPQPSFTLVLHDAGSLRRMLLPPSELSMVEAYLRGDIDIEGDLESASVLADGVAERLGSVNALIRLTRRLLALPSDGVGSVTDAPARDRAAPRGRFHSKDRDAASIRFHYDLGNDFYTMWLDRRMVYSCAYLPAGRERPRLGAGRQARPHLSQASPRTGRASTRHRMRLGGAGDVCG